MEKCAFDSDQGCDILNEKRCSKCSFYKTPKQVEEGRKRARELLNKKYLPAERDALCRRYYSCRKKDIF